MSDAPDSHGQPKEMSGELAAGAMPDAARAVLSRIRSAARAAPGRATGREPNRIPRAVGRSRSGRAPGGFSGPGPDDRDPMALGAAWGSLVSDRGWSDALDVASLIGLWPQIVGAANAEHAQPESFDPEAGSLTIRTSSTAWAEQLRLMMPTLRAAIDGQVGAGVVRAVQILGPAPPPRRAPPARRCPRPPPPRCVRAASRAMWRDGSGPAPGSTATASRARPK